MSEREGRGVSAIWIINDYMLFLHNEFTFFWQKLLRLVFVGKCIEDSRNSLCFLLIMTMMDKEHVDQVDQYLISLTKSFYAFSEKVARGAITELAPPFEEYQGWDGDIISYCDHFFKAYNSYLTSLDKEDVVRAGEMMSQLVKRASGRDASFDLFRDVKRVEEMIMGALVQSFKGFPSEAFSIVEQAMCKDGLHLLLLLPQLEISNSSFYRVRKCGRSSLTKRCDLFHVPFHKRELCGTYRYSIPGYPSLYMSHRISVAKLETDIKPWNCYCAACFKTSGRSLRFIDLSLTGSFGTIWERYSLLVFYPLIMACGLKVKNETGAFKPEYVIPQLLAQVIRLHMMDGDFDGISYISTKLSQPDFMDMNQRNFVMWIIGAEQEKSYSKYLADKMVVSTPKMCYPWNCDTKIEKILNDMEFDLIEKE